MRSLWGKRICSGLRRGRGAKSDVAPYQGTGMAYVVPGWKAGDKTSWEQQLKTRTQAQDDYAKAK